MPADQDGRRIRRARDALAAARQDARDRGDSPGPARSAGADSPERHGGVPAARRGSGGADPQPLSAAIGGLLAERGWRQRAAVGAAFGRWEQIVGAELAAHARPDGFSGGELVVTADSTAWATQLRLLAGTLVRRLNAELGEGTVRRVRVRGPAGPPRPPGGWRVPGGPGPRDTYG